MDNSSALFTDQYEITMIDAALQSGIADKPCVFEVHTRALPAGRAYGVFAGVGRLLEQIQHFRFTADQLQWLAGSNLVVPSTIDWLADYRFQGDISGYREGEIFFPYDPVLTVSGTFAQAIVLETLILSCLNFDSAVASAAARMVSAAKGKPLYEMGSRRIHESAAVAAARAAYVAGFAATSNLAAGRIWGIPTVGTVSHAFTLVHESEQAAFCAQLDAHGVQTSLLIDTYDIMAGLRGAVEAAGKNLGAVRLDSGDLPTLIEQVRSELDRLGAEHTRIIVTSDLDEYSIAAISSSAADALGVGTSVVTGSGFPTTGFVYKPVACKEEQGWRGLSKKSAKKVGIPGQKTAWRLLDDNRVAVKDYVCAHTPDAPPTPPDQSAIALTHTQMENGQIVADTSVQAAREYHRQAIDYLPAAAFELESKPAIAAEIIQR